VELVMLTDLVAECTEFVGEGAGGGTGDDLLSLLLAILPLAGLVAGTEGSSFFTGEAR
jgi:hypothetical protein